MKNVFLPIIMVLILAVISSCNKNEDIDTEKPVIENDFTGAFPQNCDTLYFGEEFTVRLLFIDNKELGSYSISMHNNFDHHSHTTEVANCDLDSVKTPINPYTFIQDYSIPEGTVEFKTEVVLNIPGFDTNGEIDEGDYHFFVSLTDREGWSTSLGLSVKLFKKN